jgi:hypothetical protein
MMRFSVGCNFSRVPRPLHYFSGDIAEWAVCEWEVRHTYFVCSFPNHLLHLQMYIRDLEL